MTQPTAVSTKPTGKAARFAGVLLVSAVATWLLRGTAVTGEQVIVLFLTLVSIGLWVTEATPPFAVALLIIATLVFTLGYDGFVPSPEDMQVYTGTLSSSVI